jgi:hypothetical protein
MYDLDFEDYSPPRTAAIASYAPFAVLGEGIVVSHSFTSVISIIGFLP